MILFGSVLNVIDQVCIQYSNLPAKSWDLWSPDSARQKLRDILPVVPR